MGAGQVGWDVITGVYSLSGDEPLKQAGFNATDSEFEARRNIPIGCLFRSLRRGGRRDSAWPGIAGAIPPAQGTPGATSAAQGTSGAAQSDTTVGRTQARVRR